MRFVLMFLVLLARPGFAQEAVHGAPVRALAMLPDWTLVSGGMDARIILRRVSDGAAHALRRVHDGPVTALVALPDGGFASGGQDGRIAIWGRNDRIPQRWLEGHVAPISALAADDDVIVSGSWLGLGLVWQHGDARVLSGHSGPIGGVALLADGTPVTVGFDGTVRLWPPEGGVVIAQLGAGLNAVAVLGEAIAVAGADGILRLLRRDGSEVAAVEAGLGPLVALSAAGGRLAAAALSGSAMIVDAAGARITAVVHSGEQALWAVAFNRDGSVLYTAGGSRAVRAWDAVSGRPLGAVGPVPEKAAEVAGDRGAQVFRACAVCHALRPGEPARAGPSLHGMFGRQPGTLPGFAYSEALQRLGPWTAEGVARLFEVGPQAFAPGTSMPEQVLADPADRKALVDCLLKATK